MKRPLASPRAAVTVAASSGFATLFGLIEQVSPVAAIAALPIALWEFSLGVYLVVKGLKPSSILVANIPSVDPEAELSAV